jgi:hypothetical protein
LELYEAAGRAFLSRLSASEERHRKSGGHFELPKAA